uniref:Permease YjgP/YjgQ n=1 Tax=Chlorobium chlorochromatii (strain CaD3) TaxID=340177 RepID=Q3ATG5_CHLCH
MTILDRYILKKQIAPFFFAFITIVALLQLQFFSTFAERFIGKGITFVAIVELLALQSAWMVSFALPMAVLVAVVMSFGTLTTTSEMTVCRASGISLYRVMVPVIVVSLLLSFTVERFNNVLLPQANYQAKSLMAEIARSKPAFGLTEQAFSTLVDGYSMYVRSSDERHGELRGVVIHDMTRPEYRTTITATRGRVEFTPDYQYLVMTLRNGAIHQLQQPEKSGYRSMNFERYRFVFESSLSGFTPSSGNRMRADANELSAGELHAIGLEFRRREAVALLHVQAPLVALERLAANTDNSKMAASPPTLRQETSAIAATKALAVIEGEIARVASELEVASTNRTLYNRYMAAYHKKYSLSLACVVFVLVGAPLGVLARRGGFGVGAAISLLFFVLYWMLMISGEKMAERGVLDPMIAMWMADGVMALIGVGLVTKLTQALFSTSR